MRSNQKDINRLDRFLLMTEHHMFLLVELNWTPTLPSKKHFARWPFSSELIGNGTLSHPQRKMPLGCHISCWLILKRSTRTPQVSHGSETAPLPTRRTRPWACRCPTPAPPPPCRLKSSRLKAKPRGIVEVAFIPVQRIDHCGACPFTV